MTSEERARRWIRISLLCWAAAMLSGAVVLLCRASPDPVLVVLASFLSVIGFGLVWHHGLFPFDVLFKLGWILFARRAPWAGWREASMKSLRILPWASAAGAALWLVHVLGPFRGWPGDAIMGVLANVLGALVYGSILLAWRRAAGTV